MPRIVVCEDDPRFGALLLKTLSRVEDFTVLGLAVSGEDACRAVREHSADLLLLDLELPAMSGLEAIRALRPSQPGLEILVLTTFADEERVFEALHSGAAGYLVKGIAPTRIAAAIREVLAGGTVIEPRLARRFWNYFASCQGGGGPSFGLTDDELQVLRLVARGLTNPEAAQAIGASRREIKAHLESIYRKLSVTGRVAAAVKALQAGLIVL